MFKKYGIKTIGIFAILFFAAVYAWTHSGGLDQNGGHWDRKRGTYHYHRPRTTTPSRTTTTPSRTTRSTNAGVQPANQIYNPTRLDWLELQLNAKYSYLFLSMYDQDGVTGTFIQDKVKGTIIIEINYEPHSSVEDRNDLVELMKGSIKVEAYRYGWQNWVKTEVKKEVSK